MADTSLYDALIGLQSSPNQSTWGLVGQGLAATAPALISPYNSPTTNVGISIGSALVQGLLARQAKISAAEDTLAKNKLALELMTSATPQARIDVLSAAPSEYQTDLAKFNDALTNRDLLASAAANANALNAQKELEVKANFALSDLGEKLYQRELDKAVQLAQIAHPGPTDTDKQLARDARKLETYKAAAESIAKQFDSLQQLNAAEFEIARRVPGSKAEMAYSNLIAQLPNLSRLTGNISQISDRDVLNMRQGVLGPSLSMFGTDLAASAPADIANRIRNVIATSPTISSNISSVPNAGNDDAERKALIKAITAAMATKQNK